MNLQLSDKTQQVNSNTKTETQFQMTITPFEEYPDFAYVEATEKVVTFYPNKITSTTKKETSGIIPTALAESTQNFSFCEEWLLGFRLNIPMDSGKCCAVALTDEELAEYQKSSPEFYEKCKSFSRITKLPTDNRKIYLWNFAERQLFSLDLKMVPKTVRFYFGRAFNPEELESLAKTSPYPFEISEKEACIKILLPEKEYTDNTAIFYNEGPKVAKDHVMRLIRQEEAKVQTEQLQMR